ncbi:MAG: 2Fe-2S iron-sulfur cluster-binding protein, partial [Planctomycetota bacterium]
HPILDVKPSREVTFTFNGRPVTAREGEVLSSALIAHGIVIFGRHHRDGSPQGIFCANGQCSQCLVIADGRPVKACMTAAREGMAVESADGLPGLAAPGRPAAFEETAEVHVDVLIVGGGPAGLTAADKLAGLGIGGIIVDDKPEPGGKLTLQTHSFFGSVADCYAGERGFAIGRILTGKVRAAGRFELWADSTAVGVFHDGKVGVVRGGRYVLVTPKALLVAAGAREKSIAFEGCDLPGVYGAGAFQTLLNRDLVRPAERLLIVGGGNVGLIAAYHALQAGIEVAGIVEALPSVGGYKVHLDKIRRSGVPVWTSHTVVRAVGGERVEKAVICRVDGRFRPVEGTARSLDVDTILIAVGLAPVNELAVKAAQYGVAVWTAGDASEIAEASAAMFSGRIAALRIAAHMGRRAEVPEPWVAIEKVLKSRPGETGALRLEEAGGAVEPVIRCVQKIPCNPCTEVCPLGHIQIPTDAIMDLPRYGGGRRCLGCGRCVLVCPGLAISLLVRDYDPSGKRALVIVPFEMGADAVRIGGRVATVDMEGGRVGTGTVAGVKARPGFNRRVLVAVEVPWKDRLKVAGFTSQETRPPRRARARGASGADDPLVCRCVRVRRSDIVREIRRGVRDFSELKATLRTGMGACGGKNCTPLIERIFLEEGVGRGEVTPPTIRPFTTEVPLRVFAGVEE